MSTPCFQHDSWRADCGDCRDMDPTADAAQLATSLRPTLRKGLMAKPGSGAFSTLTFERLKAKGLIDDNFMPTDLGQAVRRHLGCDQ